MTAGYALRTTVRADFSETVEAVRAALARQGFGVLAEIDVAAIMKAKLDVDMPPHVILGACNPPLAHRALTMDPSISLMLPCNVVVRELDAGQTLVEAIDPQVMVAVTGRSDVAAIADEARRRLEEALADIREPRAVPR